MKSLPLGIHSMNEPSVSPPPLSPASKLLRFGLIGAILLITVLAFGYVGGWLAPDRLTAQRIVNQLQANSGVFPGYRRNHAKGVCVMGYFESNGNAQAYSVAQVFAPGRTPVVGRFALPSGNPYGADSSVPIRSLALRLTQPNGQQWRTGMNSMPVFPVATPQGFYELAQAQHPDPSTGKPDPAKLGAFFGSHPEAGAFLAWVKTAKPSASYATESYWGLNAFELVDANGGKHAVRWRVVPENGDSTPGGSDPNYLEADLERRLAQTPQRWHLVITLANPGDPTNDATKVWPADRRDIDAGMLVLSSVEPQESGPCRDINYDPLVLPNGIQPSDDPLLPARSAAYATSYLRRTSEEAHLPGTPTADIKPEAK
jgi:catalase